jgi:PST family polysaccharide transporter
MARSGRSAVLITLAGQWTKYLISFLSLIVLARLLTPSDYGMVAVASSIVGIALVLADFGISLAALQADQLSAAEKSNLFWANLIVSVVLFLVIVAISSPVSTLFAMPALRPLLCFMALAIPIGGFGVQFKTQLNRDGKFGWLAGSDVFGQATSFLVALLGAAVFDWGYWSLASVPVVLAATSTAISVLGAHWWPGRIDKRTSIRTFLRFGVNTLAAQLLNYISSNLDQLLVGRAWGAAEAGFYNRAVQVARMPLQQLASPLTRVMLPRLARQRGQETEYRTTVHRAQVVLCYALIPLLGLVAALSEVLIEVALGPAWVPAAPTLSVLALAGVFQSAGYILYWVMLAEATTSKLLWSESIGRVIMIVLMFVSAPFDPLLVAWSVVVGQAIIFVIGLIIALPRPRIPVGIVAWPALRAASLAGVSSGFAWWTCHLQGIEQAAPFVQLIVAAAVSVLGGSVFALLCPPVRRDLKIIAELARRQSR